MVTDMALLSSVAALHSMTSPDSVHYDAMSPMRWMTSLFPGCIGDGASGEGSWWRLGGMSSATVSTAGRR